MSKTNRKTISITLCFMLIIGTVAMCGTGISDLFQLKVEAATQINITSEQAAKWAADNFKNCPDFDGTNFNINNPTWGDPQCVDLIKWYTNDCLGVPIGDIRYDYNGNELYGYAYEMCELSTVRNNYYILDNTHNPIPGDIFVNNPGEYESSKVSGHTGIITKVMIDKEKPENSKIHIVDMNGCGGKNKPGEKDCGLHEFSYLIRPKFLCKQGDVIEFGSYPQSLVTDSSLISSLNNATKNKTWTSYNYYSGQYNSHFTIQEHYLYDGTMAPGDWMRYLDIDYNNEKYRAVVFDSYRPLITTNRSSSSEVETTSYNTNNPIYYKQYTNGYYCNNVYWFKFEPLKWTVLDTSNGFVLCNSIIDCQYFNNYSLFEKSNNNNLIAGGYLYGDANKTFFACDYSKCSLRQWLNNDFYNLFTEDQKADIATTHLDNKGYYTLNGMSGHESLDVEDTYDKVFLPSYDDVKNPLYGFDGSISNSNTRIREGTDYALAQGLFITTNDGKPLNHEYKRSSFWMLRTAGDDNCRRCGVDYKGYVERACYNPSFLVGIVPSLCNPEFIKYMTYENGYAEFISESTPTSEDAPISEDAPTSETNPTAFAKLKVPTNTEVPYAATVIVKAAATDVPEGYYVALYDGNNLLKKGSNREVSYTFPGEFTSTKNITVKIIDDNENVQKDADGKELTGNVEIKAKSGFFDKLIAFFKRLFKALPSVTVEPK